MSTQFQPKNSSSTNSPTPPPEPAAPQASEASLARFGSLRVSQNNLISMAIGIFVGLALGLLIGWVWWPVEWQGAGLGELNRPARAAYLAAIADSFAASDDSDSGAAAEQRLATLGADLPAQFDDAIRYYAGVEPPDRPAITNLVKLAIALGLPLESVAAQLDQAGVSAATEEATDQPAASAGASAAPPASSSANNPGGRRWSWLWVILLGALLVGGGVFLLRYIARRKPATPHGAAAAPPDDSPTPTSTGAVPGGASSWPSQTGGASGAAGAPASRTAPPTGQAAAPNLRATIPPSAVNAAAAGGGSVSYLNPALGNGQGSEHAFDNEDAEDGDEESTAGVLPASASPAGQESAAGAPTGADGAAAKPAPGTGPAIPASSAAGAAAVRAAGTTRVDSYPLLQSHTAIFQLGLDNFDFAKNIPNPAGAGYLGEYGMVIPERLGTVGNNLEQVVAIEVNLFDKTDDAKIETVTRFLLSEYAMDHLYDQFDRERRGVDPISAQPGTRFALEGRQLLLDCVIREVAFTPEHYFKKLTVEMNARRKIAG